MDCGVVGRACSIHIVHETGGVSFTRGPLICERWQDGIGSRRYAEGHMGESSSSSRLGTGSRRAKLGADARLRGHWGQTVTVYYNSVLSVEMAFLLSSTRLLSYSGQT